MDKLCKVSFRQNQLKETELVQIDFKVIGMMEEGLKTMSKKIFKCLLKKHQCRSATRYERKAKASFKNKKY